MTKVLISGGTGLIGRQLCKMLLEDHVEVVVLTTQRKVSNQISKVRYVFWNPKEHYIDPAFTAQNISIINLAGAGVAEKRWTASRKQEIIESRTESLQTLYHAIASKQIQAIGLVSVSAIGYYAFKDRLLSEADFSDRSFLSSTCTLWEEKAIQFSSLGLPVAIARVGIVLSTHGGALKEFLKPLKFGIAGIPGDGKQMLSWIHIEDICRLLLYLNNSKSNDTYNAVADLPVSTNELFDNILKIKNGIKIHIPAIALKLALGEMSIEILKSAAVSNQKIRKDGFQCKYPAISQALENLLN